MLLENGLSEARAAEPVPWSIHSDTESSVALTGRTRLHQPRPRRRVLAGRVCTGHFLAGCAASLDGHSSRRAIIGGDEGALMSLATVPSGG
jgi:hypothetical protein